MHRLLQLTLDLFDPPAADRAAPPTPTTPAVPTAHVTPAPAIDSRSALPLDQALDTLRFVHPAATRQTLLDGVLVAYEFRRVRRRNIGFTVGAEGLVVSAPKWVPQYEVDVALQKKAGWIVRKLGEMRERSQRRDAARIEWQDGAAFPFLGEQVTVVLDPRHAFDEAGAVLHGDPQALPAVPHLTLHVGLSQHAKADQIRDAVQAWLMRQAKRLFTERLDHYAPQLGVRWQKLALSNASTRWGTAHSNGTIRLNWRLIHFRLPLIDYVVAHELSHLRVMDHSPRFWETVGTVVPDYAQLRSQLRSDPLPPW